MLQTLVYLPHELFGIPLFGMGWLLLLWTLFCVAALGWTVYRAGGWTPDATGYLPVYLVVAAAIWFLLPSLEQRAPDGTPLGLPIRGYGVMLLLGVVSGVGLAAYRAWRVGIDPEEIYALAFCMFLAGIAGARLFYVIQYWSEFRAKNLWLTLGEIFKFTEGGLVVYGAVIGGLLAAVVFAKIRKLPMLALGDLIAPSMVLGLAFGRIGCLFNGCCYGGVCETDLPSLRFPAASPPYLHQLDDGSLIGMNMKRSEGDSLWVIDEVEPGSPAETKNLKPGTRVRGIKRPPADHLRFAMKQGQEGESEEATAPTVITVETDQADPWVTFTTKELPLFSQPVHPTQVYSSLNAVLIFLLLIAYYPYRRRDGEVFTLMLTIHPLTRIVLELIRDDEPGRFGTQLTISQLVALVLVALSIALWIYISRQPKGSALPPATVSGASS